MYSQLISTPFISETAWWLITTSREHKKHGCLQEPHFEHDVTMCLAKDSCEIWVGSSADVVGITPPKTNSSHLSVGLPKRKLIFQPQCFRCYVSFREGRPVYVCLFSLFIPGNLRCSQKMSISEETCLCGNLDVWCMSGAGFV